MSNKIDLDSYHIITKYSILLDDNKDLATQSSTHFSEKIEEIKPEFQSFMISKFKPHYEGLMKRNLTDGEVLALTQHELNIGEFIWLFH